MWLPPIMQSPWSCCSPQPPTCRRISSPMVPWPAMVCGSSYGATKVSPSLTARAWQQAAPTPTKKRSAAGTRHQRQHQQQKVEAVSVQMPCSHSNALVYQNHEHHSCTANTACTHRIPHPMTSQRSAFSRQSSESMLVSLIFFVLIACAHVHTFTRAPWHGMSHSPSMLPTVVTASQLLITSLDVCVR